MAFRFSKRLALPVLFPMSIGLSGCWEQPQVDAYYYPDKSDLSKFEVFSNVGSVDNCRKMVFQAAARNNDQRMQRGDYECGVDPTGKKLGEVTVYKSTEK